MFRGASSLLLSVAILSIAACSTTPLNVLFRHTDPSRQFNFQQESAQCDVWVDRHIVETRGGPIRFIEPDRALLWNRCMKAGGWYRTDGL